MSAAVRTTKPSLRIMLSSEGFRRASLAVAGALLLVLAFPRSGLWWCAPMGAAALFLAYDGASWKRSFALGWFAGWIFFSISFWWWSTTIVTEVGALAYVAVIAASALEALALGAAAALGALAQARAPRRLAPLGVAFAFAILEWLRSIGPIGNPFAQLGFSQAEAPTRIFAAYIGANGVTLIVCIAGAYLADAIVRRTWRNAAVVAATIVAVWTAAWIAWPARTLPPPTVRVAAVQGNIAQSLKWVPGSLDKAVATYVTMTRQAIASKPALIVWPETVIAIPRNGLNVDPGLIGRFTSLARDANATIVAGSIDAHGNNLYNGLFFFTPIGISAVYDKHQLVPFAEHFPGQSFLFWLPYIGELNGGFAEGTGPGVYVTAAGTVGPLICWESAF